MRKTNPRERLERNSQPSVFSSVKRNILVKSSWDGSCTFDPSIEFRVSLTCIEFQDSQGYLEGPCLKETKDTKWKGLDKPPMCYCGFPAGKVPICAPPPSWPLWSSMLPQKHVRKQRLRQADCFSLQVRSVELKWERS